MFNMAKTGYTTATDFADYLVKDKNMSFRDAYKISSKIVKAWSEYVFEFSNSPIL